MPVADASSQRTIFLFSGGLFTGSLLLLPRVE